MWRGASSDLPAPSPPISLRARQHTATLADDPNTAGPEGNDSGPPEWEWENFVVFEVGEPAPQRRGGMLGRCVSTGENGYGVNPSMARKCHSDSEGTTVIQQPRRDRMWLY